MTRDPFDSFVSRCLGHELIHVEHFETLISEVFSIALLSRLLGDLTLSTKLCNASTSDQGLASYILHLYFGKWQMFIESDTDRIK
jgi:hypothetical protein